MFLGVFLNIFYHLDFYIILKFRKFPEFKLTMPTAIIIPMAQRARIDIILNASTLAISTFTIP
jgi:hypothetical protein